MLATPCLDTQYSNNGFPFIRPKQIQQTQPRESVGTIRFISRRRSKKFTESTSNLISIGGG